MKKIVLSAVAALAVGSMSLSASQFYVDDKGQVFTTSAADRVALKSDSSTSLSSKATNLEFSGTHYFGYTNARPDTLKM
jgi:hypothetical protein